MIKMKKSILLGFVLLFAVLCEAETVQWVINPKYQSMTAYGNGMVKVKEKNGKVSIYNFDGVALVENADTVVSPAEGYGIVLRYKEVKTKFSSFQAYQVMQIFDKEFSTDVSGKGLYANLYPFFSEGKIPVFDKSKKYGYVDPYGEWVIKPQYSYVQPFCEGFAVVGYASAMNVARKALNSLQTLHFVDPHGMELATPSVPGSIMEASSFKDGEACVCSDNSIDYIINTSGSVLGTKAKTLHSYDDKHRLLDSQGKAKSSAFDAPAESGSLTVRETFLEEEHLYGLMKNMSEIVPYQFLEVCVLNDDYVIAKTNDGYGLLKIAFGTFETSQETPMEDESIGEGREKVEYVFSVPECWRNKELWLCYQSDNEKDCAYVESNGERLRTFELDMPVADRAITLSSDGITLWKRSESDDMIRRNRSAIEKISVSLNSSTVRASEGGRGTSKVVVKNNSGKEQDLTLELSGIGISLRKEILLAAGAKEEVRFSVAKISRKDERNVAISINDNVTGVGRTVNEILIVLPYVSQ